MTESGCGIPLPTPSCRSTAASANNCTFRAQARRRAGLFCCIALRCQRRGRGQPGAGEPGRRRESAWPGSPDPRSRRSPACSPPHTRRGHAPAVPAASPARQGVGPDPCRHPARAIAGARPCPRQPRLALGDGGRVRRHRRGRGVGVEGRLRGARSRPGAVPAQIRQRDAHARGLGRGDARDADPARRAARRRRPAARRNPSTSSNSRRRWHSALSPPRPQR